MHNTTQNLLSFRILNQTKNKCEFWDVDAQGKPLIGHIRVNVDTVTVLMDTPIADYVDESSGKKMHTLQMMVKLS